MICENENDNFNKETENFKIMIGCANVEEMIKNKLYADKTAYIQKFFENNSVFYFLARPRRFGKSMLLDTIVHIANGNRELFKNCHIYKNKNFAWKKYPVILLDFSLFSIQSLYEFNQAINMELRNVARFYELEDQLDYKIDVGCQLYLHNLLNVLSCKKNFESKTIILIDEFDYPLISCKKEIIEDIRSILESFYNVFKSFQKKLKFVLITGVTNFKLCDLFLGVNSLDDISLNENYACMLGFTENDLEKIFFNKDYFIDPIIDKFNRKKKFNRKYVVDDLKKELKLYYNGYCFTLTKNICVYNPDSILKFFKNISFDFYSQNWNNSFFIWEILKDNIDEINKIWSEKNIRIEKFDFMEIPNFKKKISFITLLYKMSYLTLDPDGFENYEKYEEDLEKDLSEDILFFKFPNLEVKSALKMTLSKIMLLKQKENGRILKETIFDYLRKEKWPEFLNLIISVCLIKASYHFIDKTEKSFQRFLYSFINGALNENMNINAELTCALDHLDIVLEDKQAKTVYIFELKVSKSASEALKQIHDRNHSMSFYGYSKKVLVGLKYDPVKHNKSEAVFEVFEQSIQNRFEKKYKAKFIIKNDGFFEKVDD